MHRIVRKEALSPSVTRLVVEAGRVAEVRQPGQFVIVRLGEDAERIPLTITDAGTDAGTITLVIQAVGKSTADICDLEVGEAITDVVGPLGKETDLLDSGGVDHVYAVGPVSMMRAVSALTYQYEVPTTVSLNAIMLDGHKVDYRLLADRLSTYRESEQRALEQRQCMVDGLAERAVLEAAR